MYQVSIFNNGVEKVVHYPSANQDDPHVNKLPLKEGLSTVDSLSFTLNPTNPGYNYIYELTTMVKVFDLRDDTVRFTGRVLNVDSKMDNDGKIYKEVVCEGALGFLNDTKQRGSSVVSADVWDFLNEILSNHNSKVEPEKRIYVGNVTKVAQVIHTYTYQTTLAEILAVREKIGGEILIEEVNGDIYLDWIDHISSSITEITLGVNMKDMIIAKDTTSIGSRIVPLGANNITIESVNGGYDYIEEANAKALYGVIEKTVEYKDITDPAVLMNTCIADLPKHTQAFYALKSNALDLSFISGIKADQFTLGKKINLINQYFGVNDIYSIVAMDLDLLAPYNPTLTIANRPITLSSAISDLRKSSLQNEGIYNNVQIGRSFGIRAVRSDNKVITTINATDGISIENQTKKVFYVDINGKLVAVDITADGGTFVNITVDKGTFTDITAEGGTFNNISANGGTFNSVTATNGITIQDGDASCTVDQLGITLVKGSYTSKMQVGVNSKNNGTAIAFDDDVDISKNLSVKGFCFFEDEVECINGLVVGTHLTVGGKNIETIINDRITAMVKPESLI